jgi:hypothetical protein
MADQDALLRFANDTTTLENNISLKMVEFLNGVKNQPAGFRDLGLDFLAICQILSSFREASMNTSNRSNHFLKKPSPSLQRC